MSREPEKRVLALSERGRASLQLLQYEIANVQVASSVDATRFLLRCGFSEASLARISGFQQGIEDNAELLERMKGMSFEALFLLINNAREACLMAEQQHFITLPLGLVKEVLESTLSVMQDVTALGRGRWENDAKNAVRKAHTICLTSMVGVFTAHGPLRSYFDTLDYEKLKEAYQTRLVDRFTNMLTVQAMLCGVGSAIVMGVPDIGAGAFAGREDVGPFSRADFVKRQLDIAVQQVLRDGLTPEEQAKYAGVRLNVHQTAHPDYSKPILGGSGPVPYTAMGNNEQKTVDLIPKSAKDSLASIDPHMGIPKKLIQVEVIAADWMAKELCEGRGELMLGSGKPAASVDHAIAISTNAMRVFDNTGEGETYSRERDEKAAYAVRDNVILHAINKFVPVQVMLSVDAEHKKLREFLMEDLINGAIQPGYCREVMRDRLDAFYSGLGEKAEEFYGQIQEVSQRRKQAGEKNLIPVQQAQGMLKVIVTGSSEKVLLAKMANNNEAYVSGEDESLETADAALEAITQLKKEREEACRRAVKNAALNQNTIDDKARKEKQKIQESWVKACEVHIEKFEADKRQDFSIADLIRKAIEQGPRRQEARDCLDDLYLGLGRESDNIYSEIERVDQAREKAREESVREIKDSQIGLTEAEKCFQEKITSQVGIAQQFARLKKDDDEELSPEERAMVAQLEKMNQQLMQDSNLPKSRTPEECELNRQLEKAQTAVLDAKNVLVSRQESHKKLLVQTSKELDLGVNAAKEAIFNTWIHTCDAYTRRLPYKGPVMGGRRRQAVVPRTSQVPGTLYEANPSRRASKKKQNSRKKQTVDLGGWV